MDQKFFGTPFANGGDKAAVPDAAQPSGVVTYTTGWGFDYQRTLGTDPAAKPINRQATNQILYDITNAVGALQRKGLPEFITAANNGGTAFAYGAGALVMFNNGSAFVPYVSLVAANTAVPGTDATKWQPQLYAESSSAQALAGTDGTTVMTPRRVKAYVDANAAAVPNASSTVAGITRYATPAEAGNASVSLAALTPAGAAGYYAPQASPAFTGTPIISDGVLQIGASGGNNIKVNFNGQISVNNAAYTVIWHRGNFEPNSKADTASPIFTGSGNPAAPAGFAASTSGSFGGGYRMIDGASNGGMWMSAGGIVWGTGGGSSLTIRMTLNSSGALSPSGGFQNGSSRKLKTEVGPITGALAAVCALRPTRVLYHEDFAPGGRVRLALIAEEVEAVVPEMYVAEAVQYRGEMVPGLEYDAGVPLLVAALAEEVAHRTALEARITRLESLIESLTGVAQS